MIRNGVHNVNKELKSQRLDDKYKAILERYLTCSTTTTLTETSIPTVISCQDSCPAEEGTHHIPNLDDTEFNLCGLHKIRINISLQQQFPTLDVDIRNKPQYRKLLSNMITSNRSESMKADFKAKTNCARIDLENFVVLLQFIERRSFLLRLTGDEYRSFIDPNEESQVKRFIINMEYQRWIS